MHKSNINMIHFILFTHFFQTNVLKVLTGGLCIPKERVRTESALTLYVCSHSPLKRV